MRNLILLAGIVAMGFLYGCGNDSSVAPEPEPGPAPDTVAEDTVLVIPGEPLPDYIRPVLTEGKRWVRRSKDRPNSEYYSPDYTVTIGEDTVINGITAKKLLRVEADGSTTLERIVIEVGSRVYKFNRYVFWADYDCYPQSYFTETDFKQIWIPESKGIITLQGKQRRCTKVIVKAHWYSSYEYELTDYWVEGIGPLMGYTRNFYSGPTPSAAQTSRQAINSYLSPGKDEDDLIWPWLNEVLECYDGDEKIYDYREFSPDLYIPLDTIAYESFSSGGIYPQNPDAN